MEDRTDEHRSSAGNGASAHPSDRQTSGSGAFGVGAVIELISAFLDDAMELIRKEIELAKAEFSEKLAQAQYGIVLLFSGAMICVVSVFVFAQALIAWLAVHMGEGAAALVSGLIVLAIGATAFLIGLSKLRARNLKPVRTIRTTSQNATRLKETFNDKIK